MLKRGPLQSLTQSLPDAIYTYYRRGTNRPCFPTYFQNDMGQTAGWVPFVRGALTTNPEPHRNITAQDATWHTGPALSVGVDVIFDLKQACWLSEIRVHTPDEAWLETIAVATKNLATEAFVPVRSLNARDYGRRLSGNDPVVIKDLNRTARFIKLSVRPRGPLSLRYVDIRGAVLEPLSLEEKSPINPSPRRAVMASGHFKLTAADNIFTAEAGLAGRLLAQHLPARPAAVRRLTIVGHPHLLLVCRPVRRTALLQHLPAASFAGQITAEGYRLMVDRNGIIMEAATAPGLFYGVQSLIQLIRNGDSIPCQTIMDDPHKPLRGVHVFVPSRREIPFLNVSSPRYYARSSITPFLCRSAAAWNINATRKLTGPGLNFRK